MDTWRCSRPCMDEGAKEVAKGAAEFLTSTILQSDALNSNEDELLQNHFNNLPSEKKEEIRRMEKMRKLMFPE